MPIGNSLNVLKVEKPPPLNIINHIFTTGNTSFFIKDNGDLYVAGTNDAWQQGIGGSGNVPSPTLNITKVPGVRRATCVACDGVTTLIQIGNGNIYGAGNNIYREFCGNSTPTSSRTFIEVEKNSNVKSINSGNGMFLTLKYNNNNLTAYGSVTINTVGGISESLNFNNNPFSENDVTLFGVSNTSDHFIFLQKGILKSIGRNTDGQLGNNSNTLSRSAVNMTTTNIAGKTIIDLGANKTCSVILCSDNTVYICGFMFFNNYGKILKQDTNFTVPTGINMTKISVGIGHVLILCNNGDVYAIGENTYGQLGDGSTTTSRTALVKVNINKPVLEIFAGNVTSLLYCADGTFYGFGKYTSSLGTIAGLTLNQAIKTPTQLIF